MLPYLIVTAGLFVLHVALQQVQRLVRGRRGIRAAWGDLAALLERRRRLAHNFVEVLRTEGLVEPESAGEWLRLLACPAPSRPVADRIRLERELDLTVTAASSCYTERAQDTGNRTLAALAVELDRNATLTRRARAAFNEAIATYDRNRGGTVRALLARLIGFRPHTGWAEA